ncbi:MAG: PEP/pyruvate-binding domain-containing protein, partial [Desulfuromonadales bacterium]|nr:PEP/pyruvate-binding domain-containing protein [Desulfuromonadales bacterium]
ELWDLALRVRNLFLTTPLPEGLIRDLTPHLEARFAGQPVMVRSSAPAEDAAGTSFAGLHDSFGNVHGLSSIFDRVRLVWASLWSDRALLYRRELGLDPATSAMAVIIQEMVASECSGVAFSHCPGREDLAVIEAVWGLNQGLVDGDIEPDRLLLDRRTGSVIEQFHPARERACRPAGDGTVLTPLPAELRHAPPLDAKRLDAVWQLLRGVEQLFGGPRDLEWTFAQGTLYVLQARPITAGQQTAESERAWYLSLHRSFNSLKELRRLIEEDWLPTQAARAEELAAVDLGALSDDELATAIEERRAALAAAEASYRELCIPMAHGIRLFGEVYNDRLRPADPFAFLDLLAADTSLLAVERNQAMAELARALNSDPQQLAQLRRGQLPDPHSPFACRFADFTERFGDLAWTFGDDKADGFGLFALLAQLAAAAPAPVRSCRPTDAGQSFLAAFAVEEQAHARELLELGRASYRLRDNDNLVIGQLTACLQAARNEALGRLAARPQSELAGLTGRENARVANRMTPAVGGASSWSVAGMRLEARQLVGQPAGAGLGRGRARVIGRPADLASFQHGEILVCDAIDPNMTFVVPLAAGIVERRGGMLIHGAIIAREYGLPCVTGVPEATLLIETGDLITVDGFLGQVTVTKQARPMEPD